MTERTWRVIAMAVGGREYWFVYKLKSVCAPDATGNREFKGGNFDSRLDAEKYADLLNTYGGELE